MESWGQLPCTFAGAVEGVTAGAAVRSGKKIQATIQLTPLDKPLYATCMGYLGTTMYAWDLTLQAVPKSIQAVPKSTKFKGYLIKVCLVISAIEDEILIVQVVGRTRASSHFVISLPYPAICLQLSNQMIGSGTFRSEKKRLLSGAIYIHNLLFCKVAFCPLPYFFLDSQTLAHVDA